MKFGMNLLLWTGDMNDSIAPVVEMLKKLGYDGVEMPMFAADDKKFGDWGKRLDGLGLARTAVTIRSADDNPISADANVRRKGVDLTKAALDSCAAAGCTHLVGPYHSAIGYFSGAGPTKDEWKWGVESMRQVAEHAGKVGVTLGVECLNRFETYLLNTHADSARFARGQPSQLQGDVRHVSRQYRGEESTRSHQSLRRHSVSRPYLGKRSQHTRRGSDSLGRELRRPQGGEVRRLADDRGLWAGAAGDRRGHQDLAAHVPKRGTARARRFGVHEEAGRQAVGIAAASSALVLFDSGAL